MNDPLNDVQEEKTEAPESSEELRRGDQVEVEGEGKMEVTEEATPESPAHLDPLAEPTPEEKAEAERKKMLADDKIYKQLYAKTDLPGFEPSMVSIETIDQLIKANEMKYIGLFLESEEEDRLAQENAADLSALPRGKQIEAAIHAINQMNERDPEYFKTHNIPEEMYKPIVQASTILNKQQEAKKKSWSAGYRTRVITTLKSMKSKLSE